MVRQLLPPGEFVEVYVNTPLQVCEQRDPKGLYKKARSGQIKQFTGIDSPYEIPSLPEIVLDTARFSVEQCVEQLIAFLTERQLILKKTEE
jgi:adenylylsulfate kinase-like enzyme